MQQGQDFQARVLALIDTTIDNLNESSPEAVNRNKHLGQ